jgi:hypothetical protein
MGGQSAELGDAIATTLSSPDPSGHHPSDAFCACLPAGAFVQGEFSQEGRDARVTCSWCAAARASMAPEITHPHRSGFAFGDGRTSGPTVSHSVDLTLKAWPPRAGLTSHGARQFTLADNSMPAEECGTGPNPDPVSVAELPVVSGWAQSRRISGRIRQG